MIKWTQFPGADLKKVVDELDALNQKLNSLRRPVIAELGAWVIQGSFRGNT